MFKMIFPICQIFYLGKPIAICRNIPTSICFVSIQGKKFISLRLEVGVNSSLLWSVHYRYLQLFHPSFGDKLCS